VCVHQTEELGLFGRDFEFEWNFLINLNLVFVCGKKLCYIRKVQRILNDFEEAESYAPNREALTFIIQSLGLFENQLACVTEIAVLVISTREYDSVHQAQLSECFLLILTHNEWSDS